MVNKYTQRDIQSLKMKLRLVTIYKRKPILQSVNLIIFCIIVCLWDKRGFRLSKNSKGIYCGIP